MKSNRKQIDKQSLLITNICLTIALISFLLIVGCTLFFLPFPERLSIEYMDHQMIADGQVVSLVFLFTFGILSALTYISLLVITTMSCYHFIYLDSKIDLTNKTEWLKNIGLLSLSLLIILLAFVLVWVFLVVNNKPQIKNEEVSTQVTQIKQIQRKIKINKNVWISLLTFFGVGVGLIIPSVLIASSIYDPSKVPNRYKDLTEMYTISENKPNTITLYFDRGYGLFFNELLVVDYLMFKDSNSSFIQMFPEFTSYINTISQATITNMSNPMINGSWYMQPNYKSFNVNDPFYNKNYKNMSMNDWFLTSYQNATGLFANYGYENFGLYNVPYYGNTTYQTNSDGYKLQSDLSQLVKEDKFYPTNAKYKNNNLNFISMDITEVIKSQGDIPTGTRKDQAIALRHLAAVTSDKKENPLNNSEYSYGTNNLMTIDDKIALPNLRTAKSKNSSYLFLHFSNTHEKYCYVKNSDWISSNNPAGINYENINDGKPVITSNNNNDFIVSVWYSIQKLKNIFTYLKNLPCNDSNRPWVKNQYDNTNIYVISDHGNGVRGPKKYFENVHKYLVKNNMMTQQESNYLLNNYLNGEISAAAFNSVFMRKPAKYKHDSWNIKNDFDTFFNKDKLVVDSDYYPIFEHDLQKQIFDNFLADNQSFSFKNELSWYWNTETQSPYELISNNPNEQEIITNEFTSNFLINPLENSKSNINERVVPLFGGSWGFRPNANKYSIRFQYKYQPSQPGGIYNLNNFIKQ